MRRLIPLIVLVLAACGNGDPEPAQSSPATGIRSTATVRILQPPPGAVVEPDEIPVEIELKGGTIAEKASNDPADVKPDVGHIHIIVDEQTISLLAGLTFDLADELKTAGKPRIASGQHLLRVEYATVTHGFFTPPVVATIAFTVA